MTSPCLASSGPFFGRWGGVEWGVGSAFGISVGVMITMPSGSGTCGGGTMKAVAATIAAPTATCARAAADSEAPRLSEPAPVEHPPRAEKPSRATFTSTAIGSSSESRVAPR